MEDARRSADISLIDAAVYKQSNVHSKRGYGGWSRRRATSMQQILMFADQKRRGHQNITSTKVGSNLRSIVRRRSSKYMEEDCGLEQPICSACLDGIEKCVFVKQREKKIEARTL